MGEITLQTVRIGRKTKEPDRNTTNSIKWIHHQPIRNDLWQMDRESVDITGDKGGSQGFIRAASSDAESRCGEAGASAEEGRLAEPQGCRRPQPRPSSRRLWHRRKICPFHFFPSFPLELSLTISLSTAYRSSSGSILAIIIKRPCRTVVSQLRNPAFCIHFVVGKPIISAHRSWKEDDLTRLGFYLTLKTHFDRLIWLIQPIFYLK